MNISIAMATYNGEKYLEDQINSILDDILPQDEIIISDDGSTDRTLQIINTYINKYPNVHLFMGPKKGVFKNFENALLNCNNEIIFLSDQDDIWVKGKREKVCEQFKKHNINVVMHNATSFNENGNIKVGFMRYRHGVLLNILRSCYWGCCMAIRRSFISEYLPFNVNNTAHDQLIGLLAENRNSSFFIDEVLTLHRLHQENQTYARPLIQKITFRINLAKAYISCLNDNYR